MPLVFTAADLTAQACVRGAFDPDGRMNPQKVLPTGRDAAISRRARPGRARRRRPAGGSWI
jgi:hypothetical protein